MLNSIFQTLGPVIGSIIVVFVFILGLLWLLLPLILYQIRRRLDTLIDETKETRDAIKYLANKLEEKKPTNT